MLFFDVLPAWTWLGLTLLGVLAGFALRLWLHDAARPGQKVSRKDRFEYLLGTLSQSAAIGIALTLIADLILVGFTQDGRALAGVTVLIALGTGFGAGFLRALIRLVFYR